MMRSYCEKKFDNLRGWRIWTKNFKVFGNKWSQITCDLFLRF